MKKKTSRYLSGVIGLIFLLGIAGWMNGETRIESQQGDAETLRRIKTVEWPKAYREQDVKLLDRINVQRAASLLMPQIFILSGREQAASLFYIRDSSENSFSPKSNSSYGVDSTEARDG